jgi:hypothetical protein
MSRNLEESTKRRNFTSEIGMRKYKSKSRDNELYGLQIRMRGGGRTPMAVIISRNSRQTDCCVGITGTTSGTNHNLSTRIPSVVVYGKLIHDRDHAQPHTLS